MADTSIRRQTAYLCTARLVRDGRYVRRDGWEPNYLATDKGVFSRIRLAGIVVEVSDASSFSLDDGTGTVQVRSFDPMPRLSVGDQVIVVGRPREYGGVRHVVLELVRRLHPSWLQWYAVHREELLALVPPMPEGEVSSEPVVEPVVEPVAVKGVASPIPVRRTDASISTHPVADALTSDQQGVVAAPLGVAQSLLEAIRELDPGDGAPTDMVLSKVGSPDAEAKLNFLIQEGEVFELRAGKVKVLE